jgi:hypothetical protein
MDRENRNGVRPHILMGSIEKGEKPAGSGKGEVIIRYGDEALQQGSFVEGNFQDAPAVETGLQRGR